MSSPRSPTAKGGWDSSNNNSQYPPASVLARFALFVNGMARAVILPFGPSLVYRLVNGSAEVTPTTWSSVSFNLALVFISYILGYSVGARVAGKLLPGKPKLHVYVARIGGAAIALHLFSCGAGISSVSWLVAIRFASAMMVGFLCSITDPSSLDQSTEETAIERRTGISSATAKVFLSGFAVSILGGGLSYRSDFSVDALVPPGATAAQAYTWSMVFLVATTVVCEIALRGAFSLTTQPYNNNMDQQSTSIVRKIQKFVRRIVEGKQLTNSSSNNQARVSFKKENQSLLGSNSESSARQRGGDPLRPRTASYASAATEGSDYFDCNSEISADDLSEQSLGENSSEIAQYIDGKCCYPDGSPAYVPRGESASVVPQNFLDNCRGNHEKAMKMWRETQQWRKENDVWKIHSMPHKMFFTIKGNYPHSIVGHSKTGFPVVVEQPGKMKADVIFGGGECNNEHMLHHFMFFQEYMCNCLCPSKEIRKAAGKENEPYNTSDYGSVIIMDIKGAGLSLLNGDLLRYLKKSGEISGAHYPLSIKRVLVVNVPFFASAAASTIKSVLPDSVSLDLLPGNGLEGLRQFIDDDQIPPEYGGSSPYSLGQHPYEQRLFRMVEKLSSPDIEAGNDVSDEIVSSSTPTEIVVDTDQPTPPSPETEVPAVDKLVRRRAVGATIETSASCDSKHNSGTSHVVGVNSLAFISFFTAAWSCAQGAIEIATPLWLSSPCQFGGLGYTPPRSGFTMFLAALVVLSLLTMKVSQPVFTMPHTEPLRGLRIGLCVESAVLFLMTVLPIYLSDCPGDGSVFATASTIILFTFGAMASILGRSSSTRLCEMVSDGLPPQTGTVGTSQSVFRSIEVLIAECASGRATKFLCMVGEIVGILIVSVVWAFSIDRERPSKYDGSLCVLLPSLSTGFLYFFSFFLQLNTATKAPLTPVSLDGSFAGLELGTLPERKAV